MADVFLWMIRMAD